jgi:hypothetical protein
VNRSPRKDRQLYPDPNGESGAPHVLVVYWLEVDGKTPAKDEYAKIKNQPQVMAALTAMDQLLQSDRRIIPTTIMETFTHRGIKLIEIKAPKTGKLITRMLAYRDSNWVLFVAFVRQKKSQSLPDDWKDTAANRIKRSRDEGGEL